MIVPRKVHRLVAVLALAATGGACRYDSHHYYHTLATDGEAEVATSGAAEGGSSAPSKTGSSALKSTKRKPTRLYVPRPRSYSVQCSGVTQKGYRCKRKTTSASGRCYQH